MNRITICLPYYLNAGMLAEQYRNLRDQTVTVKEHLGLIVVDDGSPTGPAFAPDRPLGLPWAVYRMTEDIPWSQDACRNLAAHLAPEGWLLLTDIDHVPPPQTLGRLVAMNLNPANVYRLSRVSAPAQEPYKPHPNSWLMTREMYWKIGGYDERLCGFYGTDGPFRDSVRAYTEFYCGMVVMLKEHLIRFPREVIPDASTTTLTRKSEENGAALRALRLGIEESGDLKARVLTRDWTMVASGEQRS